MDWTRLLAEVSFEFSRGGGPGGQHRNKTSTKAVLRWNLPTTEALTQAEFLRVQKKLADTLTREGDLLIASEELREQAGNKEACVTKLRRLIQEALRTPKKRLPTRPPKASKRKRLEGKKKRGIIKAGRQKKGFEF